MCGIAGWLGHLTESERYARRLAEMLAHRGPDACAFRSWPEATLVHTRLSIIDLSPAGAQPMANEDGTIWTVFNGEIYNHHELRQDLEARGHVFKGHSDTEVLPQLYEEEGLSFVERLRGMFALAIYDTRTRTLVLVRDRFGIKPLFYAAVKDRLVFASEIRALLCLPGIDVQPDRQAIHDFAALLYIPAPQTFYRGIRALQPGELLEARLNGDGLSWETRNYHRWSVAPNPGVTLADATDRADELLTAAVKSQMESDVPLGALLSGGIDSSLVSAAAQESAKAGIRTFNVRFPDKEYDETWAALAVVNQIGSQHVTLDMNGEGGTWEYVTRMLSQAGQPFADTSLFAVNTICRLMRQYVTVALSGDGGDEGFGGYNLYWQLSRIERLQRLPGLFWSGAAAFASPLASFGVVRDSLPQRIRDLTGADNTAIIQSLFCWLREEEHRHLCIDDDIPISPVRRLFEPQWEDHLPLTASRLERLSALATEVNIRLTLPNDFLFKVDTASMKESLEVRVPMLDEDLMAFGLSLPHHMKVRGRVCKLVLRQVAARRLPDEIANKRKQGFGIPMDVWVDGGFKARLRDTLLRSSTRLSEYFHPEVYRPWVKAFCDERNHPGISRQGLYQRVIMLLSVDLALSPSEYR
jgi:asparagine synthase (glutamine-hydrolysing)